MSSPPRVLVSGYYGCGNAGDEAMLAGLIEGFRQLAPQAELVVLSGNPAGTTAEHAVMAVPRGLRSTWRQVRMSDLLVSGGGGLLQDVTSWRSPLYYLAVMQFARWARRPAVGAPPVACIGQSVGPLRRPLIRRLARAVLSGVQVIAVRDERSREAVRELGLGREAEVTADLAFLLPAPKEDEIAGARRLVGLPEEAGPVAAIALRPSPAEGPRDLASRLGAAIGGACDELGLKPVLLAMQRSQDLGFARLAAAAMPVEAVIAPPMSARQLLALTAGCDLVIGMRLHALIFAALAGVPLVGISYDPKVDGLMEQLGLRAATSVERLDGSALSRSIIETWERRGEMARSLAGRAERLRAMALRNVELALSALPRQGQ